MKQDIIPPVNYQRGTLQSRERPVVPVVRPVAPRRPGPVFSDIMPVPKSQPVQPVVEAAPIIAPQPPVTFQDVQVVKAQPAAETISEALAHELDPSTPSTTEQAVQPVAEAAPATTTKPEQPIKAVKPPKAKKKFSLRRHGLIILAIIIVLITGYVAVDTWLTNRSVQALGAVEASTTNDDTGTWTKDDEGKDEGSISTATVKNYTVSPELPKALYIDKLSIAARTLPMSVHKDGSVQSPKNIFDAGWYTGSVKPGDIGAMFIDGHASGATREGLFAYLDKLVEGDKLQIEKGDGTMLTYKVVHVETVPLEGLDMKKMLLPYGNTVRGLNLMTCTGTWVEKLKTYDHRVLVYTEQVKE